MKRIVFSLVLMLGLVLPAATEVMAQPTAADQTFVSQLTGDEVDLGPSGEISFIEENYELRETQSFQEEYIWFTYGWSNFQMVLIGGPNSALDYHEITLGNMVDFYDTWELIDEDVSEERSWFLGEGTLGGGPIIVYYEFELDAFGDTDMVLMQFTDVSSLEHDLETVQAEVTIAGQPLLPQTDAGELVELTDYETGSHDDSSDSLEANESETDRSRSSRGGTGEADDDTDTGVSRTSRGGTDEATVEADDVDDDDANTGVSRTSRGGTDEATVEADDVDDEDSGSDRSRSTRGGTTEVDEDEEQSTSRTSRTSSGEDDAGDTTRENDTEESDSRAGRLGDILTTDADDAEDDSATASGGDWESMGLVSDTEWQSPSHGHVITWDAATWEFPVDYESAIMINEDPPYDIITLQTTDGLGYVFLTADLAYDSTPASLIEYWTSSDYAAQIVNGVTVVESGTTSSSATMIYETTNEVDQPLMVVLEATFLDDGTVIFSQISGAPESIDVIYEQFVNGVEVNGSPLQMTFTVEDIRDISGN